MKKNEGQMKIVLQQQLNEIVELKQELEECEDDYEKLHEKHD